MFQPLSKEQARQEIARLVENFTHQLPDYKRGKYNETEVRIHYINPLFKALGWDVNNDNGAAPAYCEVVHEARVLVGKASKAPDYLFKMPGGQNLFFLEAKKPSVDIKGDVQPAYQVRRYGWNAKMALSLLTDFEELAVYDCTVQPNPKDKSSKARIHYLTFDQYLPQFNFLWDNFSKESVLRGNLDRFVAAGSNRRGKETVDRAFLDTLEQMRAALAQGLATRNRQLDAEQLRFLVQMLLDRIIFLRIAEDRGVEPEDDLKKLAAIKAKDGIYLSLLDRFRAAAARYNSGLFDLDKDTLSAEVRLDNATLKPLLDGLYYPESPYEFSVIGAEILGSAYERFLGKVIQLQDDRTVVIEEKPEVRKAGGVFYTPAYIVEYIVKNTVGKLCEGSSPQQVAKLRIVDPACGSGSFLLGAYQFLLDWHLNYYQSNPKATVVVQPPAASRQPPAANSKNRSVPALTPDGRLTTAAKKAILLNNLYGVDLDEQAVEVTKLSLLLKCLEGETSASMQQSLGLERVLPTIDYNIRVGNSLVDVDFYDGELDFAPGTERTVKPFSWRDEFAEVFQQGGFDAVIGNPPYVRSQFLDSTTKNYLTKAYSIASYQPDLFAFFVAKGIDILNDVRNAKGRLGFIIPSGMLTNTYYATLREYVLLTSSLEEVIDLKEGIFKEASVDTFILILKKESDTKSRNQNQVNIGEDLRARYDRRVTPPSTFITQKDIYSRKGFLFNTSSSVSSLELTTHIHKRSIAIGEFFDVKAGMKVRKDFIASSQKDMRYKPFILGGDVKPFQVEWNNKWVCYDKKLENNFSNQSFRDEGIFTNNDKIFVRQVMGKERIYASVDRNSYYADQSLYLLIKKPNAIVDTYFISGMVTSSLMNYYFKKTMSDGKVTFPKIKGDQLKQLPIPALNLKNPADHQRHDAVVALVTQLLTLHPQLRAARLATEQSQLQARIRRLDQRLDHLVYLLYDLSYAEAQVVELGLAQRLTEAQYGVWPLK